MTDKKRINRLSKNNPYWGAHPITYTGTYLVGRPNVPDPLEVERREIEERTNHHSFTPSSPAKWLQKRQKKEGD